jgi:hypothetical protein
MKCLSIPPLHGNPHTLLDAIINPKIPLQEEVTARCLCNIKGEDVENFHS